MNEDAPKTNLQRVVSFVKQHQTPVACGVTAVVACIVTREVDARIARDFAYNAGMQAGLLAYTTGLMSEFIEEKGLKDEFVNEFIPRVIE